MVAAPVVAARDRSRRALSFRTSHSKPAAARRKHRPAAACVLRDDGEEEIRLCLAIKNEAINGKEFTAKSAEKGASKTARSSRLNMFFFE